MRNRERPAERRAEALLQILRFRRRPSVQRDGAGVEPRRVEALKHRAAHLIRAAAAAAAGEAAGTTEAGEAAAFSSGAAAAAARTATSTAACLPADRLALGAATERFTHASNRSPGGPKNDSLPCAVPSAVTDSDDVSVENPGGSSACASASFAAVALSSGRARPA